MKQRRFMARLPDFVALMKPRVMALAVFTAIVGLAIAPGHLDPLPAAIAILGIAAGAGAAGVLNMWYDADIDAVMARTAWRHIPRGRISRAEALLFGLVLAGGAVMTLALAANIQAAAFPMLPVIAGRAATTRQILIYSALLTPISILPWATGFAGIIYGVTAAMGGAMFVVLALRLRKASDADRRPAYRLFAFSIVYLFVLFAALLVSTGSDRRATVPAATVHDVGSLQGEPIARSIRAALGSMSLSREV
jgi:heme O synthase-like polyprenyltransferase